MWLQITLCYWAKYTWFCLQMQNKLLVINGCSLQSTLQSMILMQWMKFVRYSRMFIANEFLVSRCIYTRRSDENIFRKLFLGLKCTMQVEKNCNKYAKISNKVAGCKLWEIYFSENNFVQKITKWIFDLSQGTLILMRTMSTKTRIHLWGTWIKIIWNLLYFLHQLSNVSNNS